jgi:hypothetical protein
MLTYKKPDAPLETVGYSDSDFAGCLGTEKSISGYIFTLVNGAISWKSSKQNITTSPTMYAEFVACYEATGPAEWLQVTSSHWIRCCSPTSSQRPTDLLPLHQREPLCRLQRCRARQTSPLVRHTNPKHYVRHV